MISDYECSLLYGAVTRDASFTTISRRASTSPSPAYRRKASTRAGSAGDGMSGSSEISSAFRRREAFIRAGRGASSRHSSSTGRRSSRRSTSCARRRIGGARRGCGASMRPGSCRNRTGMWDSTTQAGSNRLEVSEQEVAVLLVLDPRADVPREGQMPSEISLPPRDGVGPRKGFVGEGEREVLDAVLLAHREGPDGVIRRGFGATEDRVHVGHLPLPDRAIHGGPNLAPMEAGRVRGVNHTVVFRGRAPLLEEPPDLVEQAHGGLPMPSPLCGRQFACHGLPPLPPILTSTAWSGAGQIWNLLIDGSRRDNPYSVTLEF